MRVIKLRASKIKNPWLRRTAIVFSFPLLTLISLLAAIFTGVALYCLCIYAWLENTWKMLKSARRVW